MHSRNIRQLLRPALRRRLKHMTAAQQIPLISVHDYLATEPDSEVRREYVGGYVHVMAGATTVHNRVAANFLGALHAQLRGKPSEPFNSDMKVRIQSSKPTRYYYPDGMVVCQPNEPESPFQDKPVVIAEVVSSSTRRIDESEKRLPYLTIPSLAVYLLIETERPSVSAYRRENTGEGLECFATELYTGLEETVPLDEIEAALPLRELYERVEFGDAEAE